MRVAPDERTEEGLRGALERLAEGRRTGDNHAVGQALLDLAYLVKWVRSDNHQPPFERSHALALEALALFRTLDDSRGVISAILLAVPFESPETAAQLLDEAERLASAGGDGLELARVLGARGRQSALRDRDQAKTQTESALALYRKHGHTQGMAGCHFSLAIMPGTLEAKRAHALEAIRLYRESGNRSEAAKALALAMMNSREPAELLALEPEVRQSLEEAHEVGNRYDERLCYSYLAQLAEARGDAEEAARFWQWEAELNENDAMTRLERWQGAMETTKMIIAMAKRMGSSETVRTFQAELRRLKKNKP